MCALRHPNPEGISVEERARMAQRFIKKHDVAAVTLHWFNALVWLLELTTGVALIASAKYAVAPAWFSEMVVSVFGSRANMLQFHIAIGVLWSVVLLVYGVFGVKHYLLAFYRNDLTLDRDDIRWFRYKALQILGRDVVLPEQGIYNAGQKAFAWIMSLSTLVIIFSGFVMSYHMGPQWLIQWSIPAHFTAVGIVVSGLIIHIYMAAILPEERPAFFSMLHGKVNELYAYEYHTKWWRARKAEERKFREGMAREAQRHGA